VERGDLYTSREHGHGLARRDLALDDALDLAPRRRRVHRVAQRPFAFLGVT